MRDAMIAERTPGTQPGFYVDIPVAQQGRAAPPLYHGYKALFADITTVTLDEKRTRNVTERIRNCAARMLCFLNYRLARVSRPEEGIHYSRSEFQALLQHDYGLDIIEIAQELLIGTGLVLPPEQHASTDRSFCWRIDERQLHQAFARVASSPKKQRQAGPEPKRKRRLALVSTEDHMSEEQPQDFSRASKPVFHDQKSVHGNMDIAQSIAAFHDDHTVISGDGYRDTHVCKKKITRALQEKNTDHSFISLDGKEKDGKGNHESSGEIKPCVQKPYVGPLSPEEIVAEFQDAPEAPETVLAFFDRLRGYALTGKLLQLAQEKASTLCYGDEETQHQGYSLLAIMLTTVYLLKHDPVWQENYERYCGRTGIPDVWAVNKWIKAKWPLALRRLLETGEYVRLDDGTLLSQAAYQAQLQHSYEAWTQPDVVETEREDQPGLSTQNESSVANTTRAEQTEMVQYEVEPGPLSAPTDETTVEAGPEGFPGQYVARLHASRLVRVLPTYFHVDVRPMTDDLFAIVITNACIEDDVSVLTCNTQVCETLRLIQEERVHEDQEQGWAMEMIAQWWLDQFWKKLPSYSRAELCPLKDRRFGIVVKNMPQLQKGEILLVGNNRRAEEIVALLSSG